MVCADRWLPCVRVRVSGGHLCGAEAPTEAATETLLSVAKLRDCYKLDIR